MLPETPATNGLDVDARARDREKLLVSLQHLLEIKAIDVKSALNEASQMLAEAMSADKIDLFVFNPQATTLVALGVSDTPMGARQKALGLNVLAVANGGREVEVYQSGQPYLSGHIDLDIGVLPGFRHDLGARSMIIVPLDVDGERRGAIQVASARSEAFSQRDLSFIAAVAHWVGMVMHRAELVERTTQDAAEKARAMVADELVTVLAHDLNNYITPIIGRVQFLRRQLRKEGNDKHTHEVDLLSESVERLRSLVIDLLDIKRLEEGLFSLTLDVVDVVATTRTTVEALQTSEFPIDLRAPEQQMRIQADPARLRQALDNLLSNALKHSPRGVPVTVNIESEHREDGDWALMTVRDGGPGVPSEIVPRLFSRFAPGPDSTGLGLGLYMARSIAEAHGGTLLYDSSYGGGASFCLSLPLAGG